MKSQKIVTLSSNTTNQYFTRSIDSFSGIDSEISTYILTGVDHAVNYVASELAKADAVQITTPIISNRKMTVISNDYNNVMGMMEGASSAYYKSDLCVNYEFITYDPFVVGWKNVSLSKQPNIQSNPKLRLGWKISSIFEEYRQNFLFEHVKPISHFRRFRDEYKEAILLLYQRLRLPLGLCDEFQPPEYPNIGFISTNDRHQNNYNPLSVIERFLEGGWIWGIRGKNDPYSAYCPPYTPKTLIELVQGALDTIEDCESQLTVRDLMAFALESEDLAMIYCKSFEQADQFVRREDVIEDILVKLGYLTRPDWMNMSA